MACSCAILACCGDPDVRSEVLSELVEMLLEEAENMKRPTTVHVFQDMCLKSDRGELDTHGFPTFGDFVFFRRPEKFWDVEQNDEK